MADKVVSVTIPEPKLDMSGWSCEISFASVRGGGVTPRLEMRYAAGGDSYVLDGVAIPAALRPKVRDVLTDLLALYRAARGF